MLWVVLKVRNSANPSELQVVQGINKKMFLTPARIGLTSPQLSCEANWGGRSWAFWNFTKLLLRCHWACAFTGGNGKRMQTTKKSNNSRKIRTISRVKPLLIIFFLSLFPGQSNPTSTVSYWSILLYHDVHGFKCFTNWKVTKLCLTIATSLFASRVNHNGKWKICTFRTAP